MNNAAGARQVLSTANHRWEVEGHARRHIADTRVGATASAHGAMAATHATKARDQAGDQGDGQHDVYEQNQNDDARGY